MKQNEEQSGERRGKVKSQLMTSIALNVDSTLIIWFYTIKIFLQYHNILSIVSIPMSLFSFIASGHEGNFLQFNALIYVHCTYNTAELYWNLSQIENIYFIDYLDSY